MAHTADRYEAPAGRMFAASNAVVRKLARAGLAPSGCHELQVVGRVTGELRTTPVNVLEHDGERYLVSPRGNTQWVRNARAAGTVRLRRGRRGDDVRLEEVADAAKPPLLRAYLARWGWQVAGLTAGLTAESTDQDLAAAAPGFPVFRIV